GVNDLDRPCRLAGALVGEHTPPHRDGGAAVGATEVDAAEGPAAVIVRDAVDRTHDKRGRLVDDVARAGRCPRIVAGALHGHEAGSLAPCAHAVPRTALLSRPPVARSFEHRTDTSFRP